MKNQKSPPNQKRRMKKLKKTRRRRGPRGPERRILKKELSELRMDENDGKNRVFGYAARYNTPSVDLGGFVEVLERGAFDGILDSNPDVLALFNHDNNHLLARTASGTLTLNVDDEGLSYDFELPDTTVGRDLGSLMKRSDVVGSSFAFLVDQAEFRKNEDGQNVRYISKVKELIDVSVVTTPAYPKASAALRSFRKWKRDTERFIDEGLNPEELWRVELLKTQARVETL